MNKQYDKQQQQQQTLGIGENMISKIATLSHLKCPVSTKKIIRNAKKQESMTFTQEKSSQEKLCSQKHRYYTY